MNVELMVSGKQQAVYGPLPEDANGRETDPEILANEIVAAALQHAGSLIKARMSNPHLSYCTINLHFH